MNLGQISFFKTFLAETVNGLVIISKKAKIVDIVLFSEITGKSLQMNHFCYICDEI